MNVSCIDSGAKSLYFSSTVVVVVVVTTVSVTTLRVSTSEMYPSFWAIERAVWPFCKAMFGYNLSPDLLIRSRCQVQLTTGHSQSSGLSVDLANQPVTLWQCHTAKTALALIMLTNNITERVTLLILKSAWHDFSEKLKLLTKRNDINYLVEQFLVFV